MDSLDRYVELLIAANETQNLVSRATLPDVWERHVLDAVQLAALAPPSGHWIDIGSGAGLPGVILAAMLPAHVTLIEPRAKRAAFLEHCVEMLGLGGRVTVEQARAEMVRVQRASVITARAVASLDQLFRMAAHFADAGTVWVLPKGRSAAAEVETARGSWQGSFELVPSRTDPQSSIVIARDVLPRSHR